MTTNEIVTRGAFAQEIAARAADLIRTRTAEHDFSLTIATKSSSADMVTQIDKAVESLITQGIGAAFPNDRIIGEEFGVSGGSGAFAWVVDPIDGTTNFVYGFPAYAISIAIVEIASQTTVAGVVLDIPRSLLYEATANQGARANGRTLQVSAATEMSHALIATGFAYKREDRAAQGALLTKLLPQIRDVRRAGAASLDLCMVAAGELDGYYESGLWPWDYRAGALIVAEAGGTVACRSDLAAVQSMVIASNGKIHHELVRLVQDGEL